MQITIVSRKTSAIPKIPEFSGFVSQQEEFAATEEPSPASFENAPRLRPSQTAEPRIPPAKAFGDKAQRKIFSKAERVLTGERNRM